MNYFSLLSWITLKFMVYANQTIVVYILVFGINKLSWNQSVSDSVFEE